MSRHVRCRPATQPLFLFFFFNDTATTEIYTLSLHDALPILTARSPRPTTRTSSGSRATRTPTCGRAMRSEEHTSELQSQSNLVCRLLLEKKKKKVVQRYPRTTDLQRSSWQQGPEALSYVLPR